MIFARAYKASITAMVCVAGGFAAAQQVTATEQDKLVHINQIQVIGSHNSYHAGFAPGERKYLQMHNPKALRGLDYQHAPLADQLSGGVRQIEIDIFADAKGGRFAHPAIGRQVTQAGLPPDPDFDPAHEMDKPGFKVMHMHDVDERSTCHTFVACLTQVRNWSKRHPQHLPVFILVETKEGEMREMPDAVKTEPFTAAVFDAMDEEIRSVFTQDEIITPDEVRGNATTLVEAIRRGSWPTLAQSRGKFIFLMDQKKAGPVYTQGHPALRGRILFTNAEPGAADAAFIEQNDGTPTQINALVKQGYLVRTRTDEGTEQARTNDTARRDAALSSGAQLISTDYPSSEPSHWTSYKVAFPDGLVARCNPITGPAGCVDKLLEPVSGVASSQ